MTWGSQGDGTYHVLQLPACRTVRRRLISLHCLVSLAQLGWMP